MSWRDGIVGGYPPKIDPGTAHPVRKTLPAHPNGTVVFVFGEKDRENWLQPVFQEVAIQRAVLCFNSSEKTCEALTELAGNAVCVVSDRRHSAAASKFLRDSHALAQLRSLPLVVLARDESITEKAAAFGSTVVTDINQLIGRILSFPTLQAIRSEASAGLFQGQLVDIDIGTDVTKGTDWVFSDNRQWLLQGMHASRMSWYPRVLGYDDHVAKTAAYMQGLQPVHRCAPGTFLAILREGGLMSRTELERLFGSGDAKSRRKVAITRVARHVRLQQTARDPRFAAVSRWVYKYAEAKAQMELLKDKDDDLEKAKVISYLESSKPKGLPDEDMAALEEIIDEVVKDVVAAAAGDVTGIGYHKDAKLGTAHHVFATIGPNRGFAYGSVVIILNRGLMYHPDTWISPLAATGYMGPHFWVFRHRPWSCAALQKLAHDEDGEAYADLDDVPDSEERGVEACLKSCLNMAAVEGWSLIMAREVDAMCNYLSFDHRTAYAFDNGTRDGAAGHGLDWQDEEVRKRSAKRLLDGDKMRILPDAWQQVVEYYETKDSHTLYEAHLPAFVPLGAIEKVIISNDLFEKHTDIKEKVENFVLPDERRLKDLVVTTESGKECMDWQHKWFDAHRKRNFDWQQDWFQARQERLHWETKASRAAIAAECERCLAEPISMRVAGRRGRPCFIPPDLCYWGRRFKQQEYAWWKTQRSKEMRISFACRAWHDIRVFFSSTTDPHKEGEDLKDLKWLTTTYAFCLGVASNKISFITKGILGSRNPEHHLAHVDQDVTKRCTSCGEVGEIGFGVWERYWFSVKIRSKSLSCTLQKPAVDDQVMSKSGTTQKLKLRKPTNEAEEEAGEGGGEEDDDKDDKDDDGDDDDDTGWVLDEDEKAKVIEVDEEDEDRFRLENPHGQESEWTSRAGFVYVPVNCIWMCSRCDEMNESDVDKCKSCAADKGMFSINNPVALLACGKGNIGENVLLECEDAEPIKGLKYTGFGCWNEPTTYCDVRPEWPFD